MKRKVRRFFRKLLIAVWRPLVVRREKLRATMMWRKGVSECIKAYKAVGGPRFYLWFDRSSFSFLPVVYEQRLKGDAIAMKYLIRARKIKVRRKMSVDDMKRECFYYTKSRWGAKGCEDDPLLQRKKYAEWINYYMTELSEPAKKVRAFKP